MLLYSHTSLIQIFHRTCHSVEYFKKINIAPKKMLSDTQIIKKFLKIHLAGTIFQIVAKKIIHIFFNLKYAQNFFKKFQSYLI